jgi:hypothetical protein
VTQCHLRIHAPQQNTVVRLHQFCFASVTQRWWGALVLRVRAPAVLRLREHTAECDVRQVITVVIDVEAIDCVGMKCVRVGICIEDDHGSVLVHGRLRWSPSPDSYSSDLRSMLAAMLEVGSLMISEQLDYACPKPGRSIQGARTVAPKVLLPFRSSLCIHLSAVRLTYYSGQI